MAGKRTSSFDAGAGLFNTTPREVAYVEEVENVEEVTTIKEQHIVEKVDYVEQIATPVCIASSIGEEQLSYLTLEARKRKITKKQLLSEWIKQSELCDDPISVITEARKIKKNRFKIDTTLEVKELFDSNAEESGLSKAEYLWYVISEHRKNNIK